MVLTAYLQVPFPGPLQVLDRAAVRLLQAVRSPLVFRLQLIQLHPQVLPLLVELVLQLLQRRLWLGQLHLQTLLQQGDLGGKVETEVVRQEVYQSSTDVRPGVVGLTLCVCVCTSHIKHFVFCFFKASLPTTTLFPIRPRETGFVCIHSLLLLVQFHQETRSSRQLLYLSNDTELLFWTRITFKYIYIYI